MPEVKATYIKKKSQRNVENEGMNESVSTSVVSNFLHSHGLKPARLLCPWDSPGQNTGVGSCSPLQGIFPTQGLNPGFLHCRWILYQLSHKGSPKNTGVGSLSLLQQIFPAQELNQGLLNCRWILYQLSYQGSPYTEKTLIQKDACTCMFVAALFTIAKMLKQPKSPWTDKWGKKMW